MLETLPAAQIFAALTTALVGGLHCAGMCGGFIGALQLNRAPQVSASRLALGYHAGRITSYTLAGVLVGVMGGMLYASQVLPIQIGLLVAGSLMLLLIGLTMFGAGARWMKSIEVAGLWLWQRISPLARKVYPPRSLGQAYLAGLAWGWIPCGMVYGVLPLALVAGGAWQGALVMLVFGLGTLPNLIAVDFAVNAVGRGAARQGGAMARITLWIKPIAGALIVVFGLSGLAHAARVAGMEHPAIAGLASICH
ncbi:MAG: sulfite exporter TauE/SafE family protein [Burkholderiaceae bacterium]